MSETREYFDQVAEAWDHIRAGYFDDRVREAAIRRSDVTHEMVVADVGTGSGFMAEALAKAVKQVIAIDDSPKMLKVARQKFAEQGLTNVDFRRGNIQALPLPAASVDGVFANMVLHHAPEPEVAIVEMARILKPGGLVVITDLDTHRHEWMREELQDLWLGFERAQVASWLQDAALTHTYVEGIGLQ
ncbi:MAG: methyltransferase domain-containing protein [Nitrospinae bacterium]|nr:methyltransferase domain-containing protein [Nitrospinota bacterium]